MISQRTGVIATELDVVGADFHILLAQVFGENAAYLSIPEKPHMPLAWIQRHLINRCI